MKKTLSLLLALVMCLPLCACGTSNDRIYLTLDNYDTYLYVGAGMEPGGKTTSDPYGVHMISFSRLSASISSSGKSENFNYYDIVVTAKITYTYGFNQSFEHTMTLDDVEITGQGSTSEQVYSGKGIDVDEDFDIHTKFEIISISGYVEPA